MELTISLPCGDQRLAMIGTGERNLKILRESLGVAITARQGSLKLSGESRAVGQAANLLEQLGQAAGRGQPMSRQALLDAIAYSSRRQSAASQTTSPLFPSPMRRRGTGGKRSFVGPWADSSGQSTGRRSTGRAAIERERRGGTREIEGAEGLGGAGMGGEELMGYSRGEPIRAATPGQQAYLDAIAQHDLTFCVGPAGTGKTYLAVAAAVSMLRQGLVRKLVLARPAVEAGERLGFLPGDLQEKVNPFLRPLLDALNDMMEFEQVQRFMAVDVIEVIPLAFMRGRTLNDALIILDEAQNTTKSQMLMFLTRLGHGSRMIVTGDTTQIDLEDPRESGLIDAVRRLKRTSGVALMTLTSSDIVRHSLVQRIVQAYGETGRSPLKALEAAAGESQ